MSEIDRVLMEAWGRLSRRVREDRVEAARVGARRALAVVTRPVRAWCLCIRANDTRISPWADALFTPSKAHEMGLPHVVRVYGPLLRKMTAPVRIPWPGIDWVRAGDQLGRTTAGVRRLIARGVLQEYKAPPRLVGSRGKPVPFVWSHSALDPNGEDARGADEVWGTLWQRLHEEIPLDGQVTLWRVPRRWDGVKPNGGERYDRQWRWQFVCRGLGGRGCGRVVNKLYLPVRVWTLGRAMGEVEADGAESGGAGMMRWGRVRVMKLGERADGVAEGDHAERGDAREARRGIGGVPMRFACRVCHGVRYASFAKRDGWNIFVTQVSGGLLRGADVACPEEVRARRRGRVVVRRAMKMTARRRQVARLVGKGLTSREIAARLGVRYCTVTMCLQRMYRGLGVRTRAGLCAKLGIAVERRRARRRAEVVRMLVEGRSNVEIARRLGIKVRSVHNHTNALLREQGVHSRVELVERLREASAVGRARTAA